MDLLLFITILFAAPLIGLMTIIAFYLVREIVCKILELVIDGIMKLTETMCK